MKRARLLTTLLMPFVGLVACQDSLAPDPDILPSDASRAEVALSSNTPPTALPGGPYTGVVGSPVQFDGSGSSDADGGALMYAWDFGDGSTACGPTPLHAYLAKGGYEVSLTVTDEAGATDNSSTMAYIGETSRPPLAGYDFYSTDEDTPLTVTAPGVLSNDSDADGDPIQAVLTNSPSHGTLTLGMDGSFTYTPESDFWDLDAFSYVAWDGAESSGMAWVTIYVVPVNDPPVADPDGPYVGYVGSPVAFDGSGSWDMDGDALTYAWDFGDGGTGSGVSPTHTYVSGGLQTVTLTVTDPSGESDTETTTALLTVILTIDVKPGGGPGCINEKSHGHLPVAVLGTAVVDPANIDPTTVTIEGVPPLRWSLNKDVNGDGNLDLVFQFATQDLNDAGLLSDGGMLTLTGADLFGVPLEGSDVIYLAGGPNCS